MVYPVFIYGSPVLRKKTLEINKDYPGLKGFIEDLFETMYVSDGLGLAAPQIGKSLRVFVLDGAPLAEDDPSLNDFKKVLINPEIIEKDGEEIAFNEGCLSIPNIREDVLRPAKIRITYYDEDFKFHDEYYEGLKARIIQHEYDHLEGILFVDLIAPIRKKLLKGKLSAISKGKFEAKYKVKLP